MLSRELKLAIALAGEIEDWRDDVEFMGHYNDRDGYFDFERLEVREAGIIRLAAVLEANK